MFLSNYVFLSMFTIIDSYALSNFKIEKHTIFKRKILQLLRHFQSIEGAAKSIVSWPNIKQFSAISSKPKPVTFQNHLMTCLHYLDK